MDEFPSESHPKTFWPKGFGMRFAENLIQKPFGHLPKPKAPCCPMKAAKPKRIAFRLGVDISYLACRSQELNTIEN